MYSGGCAPRLRWGTTCGTVTCARRAPPSGPCRHPYRLPPRGSARRAHRRAGPTCAPPAPLGGDLALSRGLLAAHCRHQVQGNPVRPRCGLGVAGEPVPRRSGAVLAGAARAAVRGPPQAGRPLRKRKSVPSRPLAAFWFSEPFSRVWGVKSADSGAILLWF